MKRLIFSLLFSTIISGSIHAQDDKLLEPSRFTAVSISDNGIILNWQYDEGFQKGTAVLERSTDGKTFYTVSNRTIGNNPAQRRFMYVDNLKDDASYCTYRIKTTSGSSVSVVSKTIRNGVEVPSITSIRTGR